MSYFQPYFRPIHSRLFRALTDAGVGGVSLAPLFASGEQGAIYDRSSLSSLSQDAYGFTPVTAGYQTVGMVMDTKRGATRGAELLSNTDLTTNTTGFAAAGSATISHDPAGYGIANITGAGGGFAKAQTVAVAIGSECEVRVRVKSLTYTGTMILNVQGAALSTHQLTPEFQDITAVFRATSANPLAYIARGSALTGTIAVDSFSLKQVDAVPQRQATDTARPLLRGAPYYLQFDATDSLVSTFPASLGASCTIGQALPAGASILTAQTVGTTYTDTATSAATVIIDRALTADETATLTAWLASRVVNNALAAPAMTDNYTIKADGPIVTADTGQTYVLQHSTDDKRLRIVGGKLTNVYAGAGANAGYAEIHFANNVSRLGGSFSLGAGSTNNGAATFAIWAESFDPSLGGTVPTSPCHLVVTNVNWAYGVFNDGVLSVIRTRTHAAPLAEDGTVYSTDVQIIGDTAIITGPDGNRTAVQDARIAANASPIAVFEVYAADNTTDSRASFTAAYADDSA